MRSKLEALSEDTTEDGNVVNNVNVDYLKSETLDDQTSVDCSYEHKDHHEDAVCINFMKKEKSSKLKVPRVPRPRPPNIEVKRNINDGEEENAYTKKVNHEPFYCEICDKMIPSHKGSKINRHKFTVHNIRNCDKCGKIFDDFLKFHAHRLTHLPKVKLKCEHCGKGFSNKVNLQYHINCKHVPKGYCEICDKMVPNLSEHKDRNHNPDNVKQCHLCAFTTNTIPNLHHHLQTQHKEVVIVPCPYCGKQIRDMFLKAHIKRVQCNLPEEERSLQRFQCDQCDKTFVTSKGLRQHIKTIHNNQKEFKCDHCDYRSSSKANVYMHSKRVHEKRDLYVQCQYCDKKVINVEFHVKTFHKNCGN